MGDTPGASSSRPQPQLSLFDCVCVIVGVIIGSGIYKTSPLITGQTSGVSAALLESSWFDTWPEAQQWVPLGVLLAAWCLGALIALCGALCYAELATAYPHQGGDYIYLKRAFGRGTGFFFVWCEFWIVRPANIGAVGFVFSEYFLRMLSIETAPWSTTVVTLLVVVLLTYLNWLGVRSGIRTQNILSVAKVAGLLIVFGVAFLWPAQADFQLQPFDPSAAGGSFSLAIILIMFTLGGWNDLAFVSGEVKNPQRNLLWALLIGLACVTGIYLLVTLAFVHGLGFQGVVQADEVASDLLESRWGALGSRFISALICVSTLGAINGMLYAGARIYFALGQEHRTFQWVGVWNPKRGGPVRALGIQAGITAGLVIGFGLYPDGFARLVNFSTLFFWSFFFLVGVSLFVLRRREPAHPRPYRVTGYPVVPVLFCLSSLYVLYSSVLYAVSQGGWEWAWAALIVYAGFWIIRTSPPEDLGTTGGVNSAPSGSGGQDAGSGAVQRRGPRAWAGVLAAWILVLTACGTLLARTETWWWPGELACHFPLQWALFGLGGIVLSWIAARPRLSHVGLLLVLINGWVYWQGQTPAVAATESSLGAAAIDDLPTISIACANVQVGQADVRRALEAGQTQDADVLILLEIDETWRESLEGLRQTYRFQDVRPRADAFGIAVLSRLPMATRYVELSAEGPAQLIVDLRIDNHSLIVGATHVIPPVRPGWQHERNRQLEAWSQLLLEQGQPAVMVGDFNLTPWSALFRRWMRSGDWRDSRVGWGNSPTWPSYLGPLGIPLDHALVTAGVRVVDRRTFEIPGSDHRGIRIDLQRLPDSGTEP